MPPLIKACLVSLCLTLFDSVASVLPTSTDLGVVLVSVTSVVIRLPPLGKQLVFAPPPVIIFNYFVSQKSEFHY